MSASRSRAASVSDSTVVNLALFDARVAQPLPLSKCRSEDVTAARRLLLSRDCMLLPPAVKSPLSDEHIKSLLIVAGPASGIGPRNLTFLSQMQLHCPSLQSLTEHLSALRAEMPAYLLDMHSFFRSKSAQAMQATPLSPDPGQIELLFEAGGGFLTLPILHRLYASNEQFANFRSLMQRVREEAPDMLQRIGGWKDNLTRFLTCGSVNEFVLESEGQVTTASTTVGAVASATGDGTAQSGAGSSPMLLFRVNFDVLRHLLLLGASDVQLIFLLTRLYNGARGRQFSTLPRMLVIVRRAWVEYVEEIRTLMRWMRDRSNHSFFGAKPLQRKAGAAAAAEAEAWERALDWIDGPAVERMYAAGGLNSLTLSVLRSLATQQQQQQAAAAAASAASPSSSSSSSFSLLPMSPASGLPRRYDTLDSLVLALRAHGARMESMASIHSFLNNPKCALFPFAGSVPRAEISESSIAQFLTNCPPGTSIALVLKECSRFERIGRASMQRDKQQANGNMSANHTRTSSFPAIPTSEEELSSPLPDASGIPAQFHDWTQLCSVLLSTLPAAVATLTLDRANLALTLESTTLLAGSIGAAGRAHTTYDLDSLLAVAYDSEHPRPPPAPTAAAPPLTPGGKPAAPAASPPVVSKQMSVTELFVMLRQWSEQGRRFTSFKALKATLELETGRPNAAATAAAAAATAAGSMGGLASLPEAPVAESPNAAAAAAAASAAAASSAPPLTYALLREQYPNVEVPLTASEERNLLRDFMSHPCRRLLTTLGLLPSSMPPAAASLAAGQASSTTAASALAASQAVAELYVPADDELDVLLEEKNGAVYTPSTSGSTPAAASSKATHQQQAQQPQQIKLNNFFLFIAALEYLDRTLPVSCLSVDELAGLLCVHYRMLAAQLEQTLQYCHTAPRLLRPPFATSASSWTLGREVLTLYKEGGADLDTLPLLRRMERTRAQQHTAAFLNLQDIFTHVRRVRERVEPRPAAADCSRVHAVLVQASQVTGPSGGLSHPSHQPLLSLALLEPLMAAEQLALLLRDFPLHSLLQAIALLTHSLTLRCAEAMVPPDLVPVYATWHALGLALHETVLEAARMRGEVFDFLASSKCVLLQQPHSAVAKPTTATSAAGLASALSSPSPAVDNTPAPLTHESVDRFVRLCGLETADLLPLLQELNARGVRLRGLTELAARVRSAHLEQERAEFGRAQSELVKNEVLSHFASDSCHLFISKQAREEVCKALADDPDAFAKLLLSASGSSSAVASVTGSAASSAASSTAAAAVAVAAVDGGQGMQSVLHLLHALEADSQAFDSLDGLVQAMQAWRAHEEPKKRLLLWLNDPERCKLLDSRPRKRFAAAAYAGNAAAAAAAAAAHNAAASSGSKEIQLDDPALNQLMSIQLSEASMADLRARRMPPLPQLPGSSGAASTDPALARSHAHIECIFEFLCRLNESFSAPSAALLRFKSLQELAAFVQAELERSNATPSPSPKRSSTPSPLHDVQTTQRSIFAPGYDSDDEEEADGEKTGQKKSTGAKQETGPAGLTRTGTIAVRSHAGAAAALAAATAATPAVVSDDIVESEEERARERARRAARISERERKEQMQLARHGWVLADDEEWLAAERAAEASETAEDAGNLQDELRYRLFMALSFPACGLFSERSGPDAAQPMALSEMELDATLEAAGPPGRRALAVALCLIKRLDEVEHRKYTWLDQLTLEIARRWQRRQALDYLLSPEGREMFEHQSTGSLPLFVLRLMSAINRAHGVDPEMSALDMIHAARDAHPAPFHSQTEFLKLIRDLVRTSRRAILRAVLLEQFSDLFAMATLQAVHLTDAKLDLLLGAVDDSLYHVIKYFAMVRSDNAELTAAAAKEGVEAQLLHFHDPLDAAVILAAKYREEKSGAMSEVRIDELDADGEDAEAEASADHNADSASSHKGAWSASEAEEEAAIRRRQRIFKAFAWPKCTLFSPAGGAEKPAAIDLSETDVDDLSKAIGPGEAALSFALQQAEGLDKREGVRYSSVAGLVVELARRCQVAQGADFLLERESKHRGLLHKSVSGIPTAKCPELDALLRQLLDEGMGGGGGDPYLSLLALMSTLSQTPRAQLTQAPRPGGFRSIKELLEALRSLAQEQRAWMVRSHFSSSPLYSAAQLPSNLQIARLLHYCGNSIYLLLRYLREIELALLGVDAATGSITPAPKPSFANFDELVEEVRRRHLALLKLEPSLVARFTPAAGIAVQEIPMPNEAGRQQKQLHQQRVEAAKLRANADAVKNKSSPIISSAAHELLRLSNIEATPTSAVAPIPATLAPVPVPLADARLQLLSALCFPHSHLFSKCVRPVAVREPQLDALLKATYTSAADAAATLPPAAATTLGSQPAAAAATAEWIPHPSQLPAALALIRSMDGEGLHFSSFPQFMRAFRAAIARQKREALLTALCFPRCKLFSFCNTHIEIDDAALDRLLRMPLAVTLVDGKPEVCATQTGSSPSSPAAAAAAGGVVPLSRVVAAIEQLDASGAKLSSFEELVDCIRTRCTTTTHIASGNAAAPQQP